MASKECFKCNRVLPLDDFYRHPQMADGHVNKCKPCNRNDVRKNRAAKISHYRKYDRLRGNRQTAKYRKDYIERYPVKYKARTMVGNAVRDGKLEKPKSCQECGTTGRIHGHHDDYSKPLDVRWLCAACHQQWHAEHGEAKNAA